MRLLLVEDDPEIVDVFQQEFASGAHELRYAGSRDDALAQLESGSFDVIVCDLRLPSTASVLDDDVTHGRAVLTRVLSEHSGTPVIAFSAFGTVQIMQDLMKSARQEDYLGEGTEREMLQFFSKDQLPDCLATLHEISESISSLDTIELATGVANLDLSWEHERVLRVYARRLSANVVRASSLTGGLSGSRVLRLRLEAAGAHVASVVAKLDDIHRVSAEHQKVERLVAPVLQPGTYPSAVTLVRAGAGTCGGLFYRFAGGFERSLFDLADEARAEVVGALRAQLDPWRDGSPVEEATIEDLRMLLISESELLGAAGDSLAADESRRISIRRATSHCDLHVFNVLISDNDEPMVIDFGAAASAPTAIDPVTLELSILFHPDAVGSCGDWPSREQAEAWDQLDEYLAGCPVPNFVRACREWAFGVAAGDYEVFASLYAYSARQLKYANTDHEVASALLGCAIRRLEMSQRGQP